MRSKILLPGALVVAACTGGVVEEPEIVTEMPETTLNEITAAEWATLSSRQVFFGHQSVGRDLLAGIRSVLAEHPEIELQLVNVDSGQTMSGPGFFEANIGANRFPETKADEFGSILGSAFADSADGIAMYKYCYVDVQSETDPDALFQDYVQRIDQLRLRHPNLTIVHFTVPLKTAPDGFAEAIKTRLGRPTQTMLNVKRNRYNDLLRDRYSAEPLFDLALLESTRPDGTRAYTVHNGQKVFMLAPEWTHDGGHLNEQAQYRFAEKLLMLLARPRSPGETAIESAVDPRAIENNKDGE